MITCAYLFGVCCRSRGLNSNTFLDSSDCFVRLRKNSLPVSVVQILASCMEETPKRIVGNNCFLCSFPLIPQARIIVFSKSSVHIAHLIECAVEIDLSVFSSSDPFVCNRCYKRLLRFEKAKTNLRSLQEEIKEDLKKGANRTKRSSPNSADKDG